MFNNFTGSEIWHPDCSRAVAAEMENGDQVLFKHNYIFDGYKSATYNYCWILYPDIETFVGTFTEFNGENKILWYSITISVYTITEALTLVGTIIK